MRGHTIQRAMLVFLVALFAIYTTIEYLSTRNVLAQCTALTSHDATSSRLHSSDVTVISDSSAKPDSSKSWANREDGDGQRAEKIQQSQSAAIGKVTMLYGPWAELEDNKAVLQTHKNHANRHGYSVHVLDRQIMHGMWSKLSFMLMLVLEELAKPEDKRMRWLFWFDLDIIVMNPNIPLDIYLPPDGEFSHINLIVTNDHNGLNTGSFFLRVGEWAVKYLIDIIALHGYKPEIKLKYSDQSAQELVTRDNKYSNNTMYVPQRWFNAYRGPRNEREQLIKGEPVPLNTIKPGDMQLHFAGKKVKHLIPIYLALAANNSMGWEMPLDKTKLQVEIALFWKLEKEKRDWDAPVVPTSDIEEASSVLKSADRLNHKVAIPLERVSDGGEEADSGSSFGPSVTASNSGLIGHDSDSTGEFVYSR